MVLEKHLVCTSCLTIGISDIDCVCTYQNNYPTILLEFEKCECCGNVKDSPADTDFNNNQFKKLKNHTTSTKIQ